MSFDSQRAAHDARVLGGGRGRSAGELSRAAEGPFMAEHNARCVADLRAGRTQPGSSASTSAPAMNLEG